MWYVSGDDVLWCVFSGAAGSVGGGHERHAGGARGSRGAAGALRMRRSRGRRPDGALRTLRKLAARREYSAA